MAHSDDVSTDRDYLDVAALATRYGIEHSAAVLAQIDDYYHEQDPQRRGVAAQVARQLADPRPADSSTTRQLGAYRNLAPHWQTWGNVVSACRELSAAMLEADQ